MGIAAAHREAKAKETENLLKLAEQHRALWESMAQRNELDRILRQDVDIISQPITAAEEESINLAMVLFRTTWSISTAGGIVTPKELAADVRHFFSLPLPRTIWEKTKEFRNPEFVRFVDRALKHREKPSLSA